VEVYVLAVDFDRIASMTEVSPYDLAEAGSESITANPATSRRIVML